MTESIADWLSDLGLDKYAQVFADNDIGMDVISDLTDVDLRELGISLGDRKRIVRAIGDQATNGGAPDSKRVGLHPKRWHSPTSKQGSPSARQPDRRTGKRLAWQCLARY